MKKGLFLLAVTVLLSIAGLAQAAEGELGVTLDVTYVSSYLWRGFDCYPDDHSGIQPRVNLDLYGSGFGVTVFSSRANSSGFENGEELDYTVYYNNSFFDGESYVMNYTVGWTYYQYPDQPKEAANAQEVFAAFSWPGLFDCGVVPSYTVVKMWPAVSDSALAEQLSGWAHIFGLGYDVTCPATNQVFHLSADFVYNDGVGPCPNAGQTVDSDWSHAVFGISTGFALCENLTFTPAFYYQSSWDDSVNSQDEAWTSLSMTYKF